MMTLRTIETISAELDALQDRLSLALACGVGIWDWNIKTNQLVWDNNMCVLFGVSPYTFSGTLDGFVSCLIPSDASKAISLLEHVVATREPYDYTYRLATRPGVCIHGRGKCYYDTDGTPLRFVGVCIEDTKNCPEYVPEKDPLVL